MTIRVDAPSTSMLRPLPRPVAPVGNELISSFIRRVAWANRLDPEEFRAYVAGDGRKQTGIPLDRLAILSGQHEARLRLALDGIENKSRPLGTLVRTACRICTARRGIRAAVTVRLAAVDVVCRRHRRWLGEDHGIDRQPNLDRHPEILAANRLHRRLVRRHGTADTYYGMFDAYEVCQAWTRSFAHQESARNLLQRFHPTEVYVPSRSASVEAAGYPQTVALARVLIDPALRELPFTPDTVDRFAEAVRRTVAPSFAWKPVCFYGHYDPLIELYLTEERCRRDGLPPRSPLFTTPARPPRPPASAA